MNSSDSKTSPPAAPQSGATTTGFGNIRLTPAQKAFAEVVGQLLAEKWTRDAHQRASSDRASGGPAEINE